MPRIPMWRRYARLFGADPKGDVQDELRFHIESKIDDLVAQGRTRAEARREAERQFGDIAAVRRLGEEFGTARERHRSRAEYWSDFRQDVRHTLRTLRKERGFAISTVLILALGIAVNTAVFSVVSALWLRPLPFPHASELTWVSADRNLKAELRKNAGLSAVTYTADVYEAMQRSAHSFETLAAYMPFFASSEYLITGPGEPRAITAVMVSRDFLDMLGARPALGRAFVDEEYRKGGRPAMILTHALWRDRFGSDPSIVGRSVTIEKQSVTIVGVMPPTFDFASVFAPGQRFDVFVPAVMDDIRGWGNTLAIVGRLRPGVSVQQAQAELDVLMPQLKAAHPQWWTDYASSVVPLKEYVSGKLRRSLVALWSAVGLILLIVCVNVSNLLLARAAARGKEFAMRAALGAGRTRLLRQLLAEALVMSVAGSALGVGLAYALTAWLSRQVSIALPLLSSVSIDAAALGWTLLIAFAVTLLVGLVPGWKASRANLQHALKSTTHGASAGRDHERLRSTLVISEVALACVLLVGAGLLLRSFLNVLNVDLGFQPDSAAVMKVECNDCREGLRRAAVMHNIIDAVRALPGIQSAAIADMLPLGRNRSWDFRAKGRVYKPGEPTGALVRVVTPGYFQSMGMRIKSGRDFSWQDAANKEALVVINETAARLHFPNEDPIGRIVFAGGPDRRVIGIVADVKQQSVEGALDSEMFLPIWQAGNEGAQLVVRTNLPPATLTATIVNTLRQLNPNQPAEPLRPVREIVDRAVSPRRFFVLLVSSFAGLGLGLACLGIFGVISYSVTRRTQEIGIRMALGASGGAVQREVVGRAIRLSLVGIGIGAMASVAATRWIASLLFATKPTDAGTFATMAALLIAVALLAAYLPARRASRIEPLTAHRIN